MAADNVTSGVGSEAFPYFRMIWVLEWGCDSVGLANLRFHVIAVPMPITRSQSVGAEDMAHLEEVETSATSGSSEVRDLREQVATLTDLVARQTAAAQQQAEAARRQEERMKRLEDLLLQQAAAREAPAPAPPAPVEVGVPRAPTPAPVSSHSAPSVARQERVVTAPQVQMPPGGAVFPTMVEGPERERLMARLNEFRRCNPRVFEGENVDHWAVEKWLMHMEKLFRDTFVEERDRVWLATHHLDGDAYQWWGTSRRTRAPTWQR